VVYLKKKHNNLIGKLVFRLVKKHIAGSTNSSVLKVIRELNNKGMHATVTLLNEHVDDHTKARYNTNAYVQFIKQLSRLRLNSDISIRASQLGGMIDRELLERNLGDIIEAAKTAEGRLWIEEEPLAKKGEAVELYRKFKPRFRNLGVEISPTNEIEGKDVGKMLSGSDIIKLRYNQKGGTEHKGDKLKLYKSYIEALSKRHTSLTLLEHDQKLVSRIMAAGRDYKKNLIFEIPLGYSQKPSKLKGKSNMSVYVPYGKDWIPYFINRLAEGRVSGIAATLLDGKTGVNVDEKGREAQS
jgi:proline dehydrogenase